MTGESPSGSEGETGEVRARARMYCRAPHARSGMGQSGSTPFACPNCGAQYEIVRVEKDTVVAGEQVTCRRCGGPLSGRDGRFILKYFLVDHRGALPKVRRRA